MKLGNNIMRGFILYFVLLMKSHLQSYPCPLQINSFWNLGFLLGIAIILQIITGIFLGLHYTSDLNSASFGQVLLEEFGSLINCGSILSRAYSII